MLARRRSSVIDGAAGQTAEARRGLPRLAAVLATAIDSRLLRDLGMVTIGQLVAQAITFATMPLVTRLYGAHEIGLQGIFLSTTTLFLSFATLNFPLAIVLPREDRDAHALMRLSLLTAVIVTLILELGLILFGNEALGWLGARELAPYRHLIALAVLVGAFSSIFSQFFVRQRLYGVRSRINVANSMLLNGARLGSGLVAPTAINLILANIAASALTLAQLYASGRAHIGRLFTDDTWRGQWTLALEYRDFPLWLTPQVVINGASQVLPVWLLARYLGPAGAGQYAIAIALLGARTALLGKAVQDVFYPRLTASYNAGVSPRALIVKATLGSLGIAFGPYLMVVLFGPQLFAFVYGNGWELAGEYARWLSFWCLLQLVNRPAVAATLVLNFQRGLLIYEIFSTGGKVLALWAGFALLHDGVAAIALFSIAGIVAYVALILWVIVRSGKMIQGREAPNGG
jgi:O-antigen/teichoic acid export membrane protein